MPLSSGCSSKLHVLKCMSGTSITSQQKNIPVIRFWRRSWMTCNLSVLQIMILPGLFGWTSLISSSMFSVLRSHFHRFPFRGNAFICVWVFCTASLQKHLHLLDLFPVSDQKQPESLSLYWFSLHLIFLKTCPGCSVPLRNSFFDDERLMHLYRFIQAILLYSRIRRVVRSNEIYSCSACSEVFSPVNWSICTFHFSWYSLILSLFLRLSDLFLFFRCNALRRVFFSVDYAAFFLWSVMDSTVISLIISCVYVNILHN